MDEAKAANTSVISALWLKSKLHNKGGGSYV